MKRLVSLLLALVMVLGIASSAMAISIRGVGSGMTLYVNPSKLNSINVREGPGKGYAKLGTLKKGTAVTAGDDYQDGYLYVTSSTLSGYVYLEYLTADAPSTVSSSSSSSSGSSKSSGDTVKGLKFNSYKLVTDTLIITANPTRPGGNANFRWLPSTDAQVISKVYAGDELTVIAEGKDWYQAQNSDGYIGYIMKKYTEVVYRGTAEGWEAQQAAK